MSQWKNLLLFLLYCAMCVSTTTYQPTLVYLKSVRRLNDTGYIDFYFCCNVEIGRFLLWQFNDEPALSGFSVHDAGRVVVGERSGYEYTSTLLSVRTNPENSNEAILDSILVVSFNNSISDRIPSEFEITCSSTVSSIYINSSKVVARINDIDHKSSNHSEVFLDYVLSRQILKNDTRYTHVFVCGTTVLQQFFEVGGPLIGFGRGDNIGQYRNVWSVEGSVVKAQGVLIARQPLRSISILFVSEDSDVSVTCFFGANQVQLSSNFTADIMNTITTTSQLSYPDSTTSQLSDPDSSSTFMASIPRQAGAETIVPSNQTIQGTHNFVVPVTVSSLLFALVIVMIIGIVFCYRIFLMQSFSVQEKTSRTEDRAQYTGPRTDGPAEVVVDDRKTLESDPLLIDLSPCSLREGEESALTVGWDSEIKTFVAVMGEYEEQDICRSGSYSTQLTLPQFDNEPELAPEPHPPRHSSTCLESYEQWNPVCSPSGQTDQLYLCEPTQPSSSEPAQDSHHMVCVSNGGALHFGNLRHRKNRSTMEEQPFVLQAACDVTKDITPHILQNFDLNQFESDNQGKDKTTFVSTKLGVTQTDCGANTKFAFSHSHPKNNSSEPELDISPEEKETGVAPPGSRNMQLNYFMKGWPANQMIEVLDCHLVRDKCLLNHVKELLKDTVEFPFTHMSLDWTVALKGSFKRLKEVISQDIMDSARQYELESYHHTYGRLPRQLTRNPSTIIPADTPLYDTSSHLERQYSDGSDSGNSNSFIPEGNVQGKSKLCQAMHLLEVQADFWKINKAKYRISECLYP